jgi:hypothetical protein
MWGLRGGRRGEKEEEERRDYDSLQGCALGYFI